MFARPTFGNQFQPFAFGASPFTASAGFGGISPFASQIGGYNPLLQFLTPQFNPAVQLQINPVVPQINPVIPLQINPAVPPQINPTFPPQSSHSPAPWHR